MIGGWQMAGMGTLRSTYLSLPTGIYPTPATRSKSTATSTRSRTAAAARCNPGYLWWNGYIPANQINSYDANGKPNGIMGVPADYKPAGAAAQSRGPLNPTSSDPMYTFYGTQYRLDAAEQRHAPGGPAFNDNLHPWRQQYLPGARQWRLDASLFKTIPISERMLVRFNADFFNVFNHPGNPSGVSSMGMLSTRNSGQDPRQIQLTLRLTW